MALVANFIFYELRMKHECTNYEISAVCIFCELPIACCRLFVYWLLIYEQKPPSPHLSFSLSGVVRGKFSYSQNSDGKYSVQCVGDYARVRSNYSVLGFFTINK